MEKKQERKKRHYHEHLMSNWDEMNRYGETRRRRSRFLQRALTLRDVACPRICYTHTRLQRTTNCAAATLHIIAYHATARAHARARSTSHLASASQLSGGCGFELSNVSAVVSRKIRWRYRRYLGKREERNKRDRRILTVSEGALSLS